MPLTFIAELALGVKVRRLLPNGLPGLLFAEIPGTGGNTSNRDGGIYEPLYGVTV
jgi:hypothetical protein